MKPYSEEEFERVKKYCLKHEHRYHLDKVVHETICRLIATVEQDQDTIRELEKELYLLNGGCD